MRRSRKGADSPRPSAPSPVPAFSPRSSFPASRAQAQSRPAAAAVARRPCVPPAVPRGPGRSAVTDARGLRPHRHPAHESRPRCGDSPPQIRASGWIMQDLGGRAMRISSRFQISSLIAVEPSGHHPAAAHRRRRRASAPRPCSRSLPASPGSASHAPAAAPDRPAPLSGLVPSPGRRPSRGRNSPEPRRLHRRAVSRAALWGRGRRRRRHPARRRETRSGRARPAGSPRRPPCR